MRLLDLKISFKANVIKQYSTDIKTDIETNGIEYREPRKKPMHV